MTLASDFLISSLLRYASSTFFLLSLGAVLISARLALGEAFREAAMGLNCLDDCVPVVTPVTSLVCPVAKLRAGLLKE